MVKGELVYNKTGKTAISKINLRELIEYFEKNICNYRYTYILENGQYLKLEIKLDQIPHLLGFHYLKRPETLNLNGIEGIENIKNEAINLKELRRLNREEFKKYVKERTEYLPCIETILNKASFIDYDWTKVRPLSQIPADYMIYCEEIKTWVLLAIKNVKGSKIKCVPLTLLIDRDNRFTNGQQRKKVIKFEKELIEA